jgi:hypothetical protein
MQNSETTMRPARKSKGQRGLLLAAVILVILCGMVAVWWRSLTVIPSVAIPTPTMPSPNAFDLLGQANDRIQEGRAVSDAVFPSPSAGQRAYTQAEREALLAKNTEALKQVRAALLHEYLAPPSRSVATDDFTQYAKFRELTRLLRFEGQVYAGRGDWGRALQSDLDALQLGITIPRGAVLIGQLVGIACEAIGRAGAWKKVDHLSASEAKAAARRLEQLLAKRFSYADTLQEEKWASQAGLIQMFRYANWRSGGLLDPGEEEDGFGAKFAKISSQARLHLYSNATILKNYTHSIDALIARARQPYPTGLSQPLPYPGDPVSEMYLSTCRIGGIKDLITQTQDDMLLLALALRAYRLEHSAYPQKLDALVPGYLSKLPIDPFGTQSFGYQRSGEKYLLYSVGPDATDDGGRPIDNPSSLSGSNASARYSIQPGSKGDIVLGVNRY